MPGARVLDPRLPEVRRHVVELCVALVVEYGLDGLKLDFLDEAAVYAGDGGEDVGRAMTGLLAELRAALESVRPGVLLELRQPYAGPGMAPYGNLLRSFDCPGDATANRVRTLDTALLAVGGAVHSDMVMWSRSAPVEAVARQLIGALHCGAPGLRAPGRAAGGASGGRAVLARDLAAPPRTAPGRPGRAGPAGRAVPAGHRGPGRGVPGERARRPGGGRSTSPRTAATTWSTDRTGTGWWWRSWTAGRG
ncbi:hypothetical protein [Streptomyces showdoensis]|uniref:hypothetical protein n=1 Tax=Streptomyces showdoensis TaxID=68268 RepID=UPI0031E5E152